MAENHSNLAVDTRPHRIKQLEAFGRYAGDGLALVFAASCSLDQPLTFKAVDKSGDVGGAVKHAACDLAAGMALRVNTAQDAEHVVLRACDPVFGADAVHQLVQCRSGDQHTQQRLLCRAGEGWLLQAATERFGHESFIAVRTWGTN